MSTNTIIFLFLWLLIGFIFGFKINLQMIFGLNRIEDENLEYDYLTFEDILFLILSSILCSTFGIVSLYIWLAIQFEDKKIIVIKRSKVHGIIKKWNRRNKI